MKRSVTKPDEAFYFVMSEVKRTMDKQYIICPGCGPLQFRHVVVTFSLDISWRA